VLKHWLALDTKGLRGHRIDWLVWQLTITIACHYMHTLEMKKKGFIKNKVMEAIITRSVVQIINNKGKYGYMYCKEALKFQLVKVNMGVGIATKPQNSNW
jgi:hypothetical protein